MKCYYVCKNIGQRTSNVEYRYRVVSIDARIYEFLIEIHCSQTWTWIAQYSLPLDMNLSVLLIIWIWKLQIFWLSYWSRWRFFTHGTVIEDTGNLRTEGLSSKVVLIRWSRRILWVTNRQAAAMPGPPKKQESVASRCIQNEDPEAGNIYHDSDLFQRFETIWHILAESVPVRDACYMLLTTTSQTFVSSWTENVNGFFVKRHKKANNGTSLLAAPQVITWFTLDYCPTTMSAKSASFPPSKIFTS